MSRLNLNHLSDFIHTELVMPPGTLPGREAGPIGSFVEHLEQATLTASRATGTEPPPRVDSRPENPDHRPTASSPLAGQPPGDTARQADPTDGGQDRQATGESRTESEPKTDACENPSESDPRAGDSEPRSDRENDRGEGAADPNAAGPAGMPGQLSDPQALPGDDPAAGGNRAESDGQAQPAKPTQAKSPSDAAGTLLASELKEAKPPGAKVTSEQNAPEDGRTDQQDSTEAQEAKNTSGKAAPQSLEPDEAGGQSAEDATRTSADFGPTPADASSQKQKAAPGQRRQLAVQGTRSAVSGNPGGHPTAQSAPDLASPSMQQDTRARPDPALPTDAKAGVAPPPAEPNALVDNEEQTTPPTRVQPDQGSRRTSATQRPEGSGSDQAERVRFVQRVARAFETLGERGGTIRLRLHPPELGSLRLEVSVRHGVMSARLEVETAGARNMLLDNLPALRHRLAEQDIRMERFDVDLTDRPFGGSPQRPSDQPPHHDPQDNTPGSGGDPRGAAPRPAQPRAVAPPGEGSQLDVII
jgi:flagellar hook-length control protein FliK